jgi:hypothetical protein
MPPVVPSDVFKVIDASFIWAKDNAPRAPDILTSWAEAPSVAAVVALLSQIPASVIANCPDYVTLNRGQAMLAHLARVFENGTKEGRSWPRVDEVNALAAVRQALAKCLDHQTQPALPYTPRELLLAFDFLDLIWERRFERRLLRRVEMQRTGGLVLPCGSEDEFRARLSDLADILKRFEPELMSDEGRKIPQTETLNRLKACLREVLGAPTFPEIEAAIQTLTDINALRVYGQHSASKADVFAAVARRGIPYPITDYADAWRQLVH